MTIGYAAGFWVFKPESVKLTVPTSWNTGNAMTGSFTSYTGSETKRLPCF